MNDLISRSTIIDLIDAELAGELSPVFADGLRRARDLVSVEPAVRPQVYINVTGGVADVMCGTHEVGVNVLDYDITPGEDENYYVDPEDDAEVWIYGETCAVMPDRCKEIDNWPTRDELDNACDRCGEDASGGDGWNGLCGNCADAEDADA